MNVWKIEYVLRHDDHDERAYDASDIRDPSVGFVAALDAVAAAVAMRDKHLGSKRKRWEPSTKGGPEANREITCTAVVIRSVTFLCRVDAIENSVLETA